MMSTPTVFQIRIIKQVKFSDCCGQVCKTYEVGDVLEATADTGHYFVTTMGGIYYEEAVRVG